MTIVAIAKTTSLLRCQVNLFVKVDAHERSVSTLSAGSPACPVKKFKPSCMFLRHCEERMESSFEISVTSIFPLTAFVGRIKVRTIWTVVRWGALPCDL